MVKSTVLNPCYMYMYLDFEFIGGSILMKAIGGI